MEIQLTPNAIQDLYSGATLTDPILQVTSIKPLKPASQDRFRAFLSDGQHFSGSSMFGTQLNDKVKAEEIDVYSIIKLDRYVCNTINQASQPKKIIIILECTVLASGSEVGQTIGSPVNFESRPAGQEDPREQQQQARAPLPPRNDDPPKPGVHPIASLTPYQNKWTIRARVTNKSNIRTWSNSKGDGKLFSMDLLDESGEIRATAFTDQCDKYYNMIEVDQVYYISQASLKTANKQFTSLKNDYEMTFNNGTQVTPCTDNTDIPTMQFEFISIAQIELINKESIIDTIGICKFVDALGTVTQRSTGRELKKRDVQLVDESGKEIRMTLWGQQAEDFDGSMCPVVAVKGAKVSDFNGKSLSVTGSTTLQINPDVREAHKIRAWFDKVGSTLETVNLSSQQAGSSGLSTNFKALGQAAAEGLGSRDAADYYTVKATTTLIRSENCLYPACPSDACNKKVVDQNNGVYRCEKCNRDYDTFDWRLMLNASIADGTDNVWVTMFQDQAEALLGCTAKELASKKEMDNEAFQEVFQKATFKEFSFKLRVKMEMYNENNKLKTTAASVAPLDYVEYNKKLIAEIQKMADN